MLNGHIGAAKATGGWIFRPKEPLFFANAEHVATDIVTAVNSRSPVKFVILSLEESSDPGSTAACLIELYRRLKDKGQQLIVVRVKSPVRELLAALAPEKLGNPASMF